MFGKKKAEEEALNLLELVPRRKREFEVDENNVVTVMMPRFENPWMLKSFVPRWKSPYVRTKLDDVGSFVWLQCDGETPVEIIAERMREHFGEKIEPAHERLKFFFQMLTRRTWLTLHHADGTEIFKS
ncbi:MAG: PqqD family protein [Bacteroidota bacterium]